MNFDNIDLCCQVLGSIMKDPKILNTVTDQITLDDFSTTNEISRVIFFAINTLVGKNVNSIDYNMISSVVEQYDTLKRKFILNNGPEFVQMCLEKGDPENFQSFLTQLKKNSLLRDLKKHGYDISEYDFESKPQGSKEEFDTIQRYEEATIEDIFGCIEKKLEVIKGRHILTCDSSEKASDGIFELIDSLSQKSDQGAELRGKYFNSITRGARLGTFYLRSASSGVGKTRSSVFDACNIVYPIRWNKEKNSFIEIKDIIPQKTLYVVTEQKSDEIRLIILAFLSGIEERRIRSRMMTSLEEERLKIAAKIINYYEDYFYIIQIPDPNLTNVRNTIKREILINNVSYVFYDYIFTSPSLISQFSRAGIREDVALGMLANELKTIAQTYNVFIMSSTQLNGNGLEAGVKRDQRMLRG